MTQATLTIGDALELIAQLPDNSINMMLTSPPYFLQRAYLPAGHPDTKKELGREPTPGEFLQSLLVLMDTVWPKLTDDATFWVNLGDTHAGSGGAGGDYQPDGLREAVPRSEGSAKKARAALARNNAGANGGPIRDRQVDEALGITQKRLRTRRTLPGYPRDQSACFLPHLFGASLAYGQNLLTGEACQQWVVRPPVTWCKPSVTPGNDGRKFRSATELIIYGGKHQQHYWDIDPVRVPNDRASEICQIGKKSSSQRRSGGDNGRAGKTIVQNPLGRPPYNWWEINTVAYPQAHYATFPPELCVRPIIVGSPAGGTVLDPFAGSGTTLAVATGHGRNAIGFDLDERNVELVRGRVGMFLEVVE